MNTIQLASAFFLGIFLATGDHLSMRVRERQGNTIGLTVWFGFVGLPIVAAAFFDLKVLAGGLILGGVFSGAWLMRQRRHAVRSINQSQGGFDFDEAM